MTTTFSLIDLLLAVAAASAVVFIIIVIIVGIIIGEIILRCDRLTKVKITCWITVTPQFVASLWVEDTGT